MPRISVRSTRCRSQHVREWKRLIICPCLFGNAGMDPFLETICGSYNCCFDPPPVLRKKSVRC